MSDQQQPSTSRQATLTTKQQESSQAQAKQERRKRRKRRLSMTKKDNKGLNGAGSAEAEESETLNKFLEPLVKALHECEPGNEMKVFLDELQPSEANIELGLTLVKRDLHRVLSFQSNAAQIFEFGSVKSGLAMRDSDLDFYIHYQHEQREREDQIKMIHVVASRMEKTGLFGQIVKITGAKVPLLRAIHQSTNCCCDINFSNARGCYNSKFIKAVMQFDPRILHLAMIIKFWSKCAYVLDEKRQFNSYCLVMMLIFYLQTRKLPVIPSVEDMQQGIPRIEYGPWNLGYPQAITYKTWNENSLRDLLIGFFRYYSEFEFTRNLISPFVGRLCSLEELEKKNIRELAKYYRACEVDGYTPLMTGPWITIQDPFELNLNVARVMITDKRFEQLRLSLQHGYDVCTRHRESSFAKLLEALFTDTKLYTKAKPSSKAKNGAQKGKNGETNGTAGKDPPPPAKAPGQTWRFPPLENELFVVKQILLTRDPERKTVITEPRIRELWSASVLEFMVDILRKLFMVELEPVEEEPPQDEKKPDTKLPDTVQEASTEAEAAPSDLACPHKKQFIMTCERQVFIARKRIKITNEAELKQEIDISKQRWDRNHALRFKTPVELAVADGAVEVRLPEDQRKNGPLRLFMDTCFLVHIRKCLKGYFYVMLSKAQRKRIDSSNEQATDTTTN
ncbi:speckle targeted PIP5K1A-regulated poly(A) polymerase [Anopheles aquasalis]|uniref:speckle targeted PIP5K1A-regulated poly(A) polymerase n=1 Tax=Anopheles aquasalis TaxID=42839 RepID=UPI00215B06DB|nr:speckle targeted PIP5K1A-regulated poly(A) polymerase [Anopheles aquasalis]